MLAIEFFIPLAGNDGHTFTASHHLAFETVMVDIFGGFSRLPGTVTGRWADAGRVYHDDLVVYLVALPSITAGDKVARAVEVAKAHYAQEAIFLRYLGTTEIL